MARKHTERSKRNLWLVLYARLSHILTLGRRRGERAVERPAHRAKRVLRRWLVSVAGAVALVCALSALLVEFIAPYGPEDGDELRAYRPPARIHWSQPGRLTRPFVYGVSAQRNAQTQALEYHEDVTRVYPVCFLCHGASYRLWGLVPGDVHLFGLGVSDEALMLWGGDALGRDLFSRALYGARGSLAIALLSALVSAAVAALVGGLAGYLGGWMEAIVGWVMGFMRLLPALPVWMALGAALPGDWLPLWHQLALSAVLASTGWVSLARRVYRRVLALRRADSTLAAQMDGRNAVYILWRGLISCRTQAAAALVSTSAQMLVGETALSLLGLGVRPPAVSWGALLQGVLDMRRVALAPWLLNPVVVVVVTVLALHVLGAALRGDVHRPVAPCTARDDL